MACDNESSQKSRLISRSFCLTESGRDDTVLAKNKSLVLEHAFYSAKKIEMFKCGSIAEGTVTLESDIDRMFVVPKVVVKMSEENKDDLKQTDHVFLFDTRMSNPGYARLKLLHLSDTKDRFLVKNGVDIQETLEETTEGVFLSSKKFLDLMVSYLNHNVSSTEFFPHGPCTSTDFRTTSESDLVHKTDDIVHALVCMEWPYEALEWITRRPLHKWPDQSLIKKICNKKCYVVPIGNPESEYHALEWRISFLPSERELVWSFNDTQLNCYFILKKLHKLYFDKLAPDQLSSYHMKTILFWLSEEKGLSMRYHENLLVCVAACLDRLFDCIQQRQLPNYFNSHANLFGHKFQNDQQKKQILEKIQEVRTNITTNVLKCLSTCFEWPQMRELLSSETHSFAKFLSHVDISENQFSTVRKHIKSVKLYSVILSTLEEATCSELDYNSISEQIKAFAYNPPEGTKPCFIETTKDYLSLRCAMAYFRENGVPEDEAFRNCIESELVSSHGMTLLDPQPSRLDGMSGELYLATIYQFLRNYSMSTKIVNRLLHRRKILNYPGWCSTYHCIQLTEDGRSKQVPRWYYPWGEVGSQDNAYNVIFSYKDVHCVPYPLKFECALAEFDNEVKLMVMHPCIYANFLLCYGHYTSKNFSSFKTNLKCLQMSVDESKGGIRRHHALNILAYCYYLNGSLLKAFECFKESLQETEISKVPNAAAFHIAIILLKRFENQKAGPSAGFVCWGGPTWGGFRRGIPSGLRKFFNMAHK